MSDDFEDLLKRAQSEIAKQLNLNDSDPFVENEARRKLIKETIMSDAKTKVKIGVICVLALAALIVVFNTLTTVDKGTYHIKQAAVSGTMSAKMTPGIWLQAFGDIDVWPKADTFFFTHDNDVEGDVDADTSIEVRFNDGSLCNISGTARIIMPTTEDQAIHLVTERGHRTYADLRAKLIKPTIRNVLRHTANLMSATESYMHKRGQFIAWARDQIAHGLYETETIEKKVKDLVSGEMVSKSFTIIKTKKEKDPETGKLIDTGMPLYQFNPLADTGIGIKNFEVKKFKYEDKVDKQIAEQQKARMAVATAKAKAQEAEQNKLTIEAEGKARVAQAEYKELEKKVVAVVQAQRDKEVAVTHGEKQREVAKLERDAAKLEKERDILQGQGIAEKKRLILAADGALAQKLDTIERINKVWADAYANRKVPGVYMAGSGGEAVAGPDAQFKTFMNMMNASVAKQLKQDMDIKK